MKTLLRVITAMTVMLSIVPWTIDSAYAAPTLKIGEVASVNDKLLKENAKKFVHLLQMGNLEKAFQYTNHTFTEKNIPDFIISSMKKLSSYQLIQSNLSRNSVHCTVTLTFQNQQSIIPIEVKFDKKGKIDDFYVNFQYSKQKYQLPSYVNPDTYDERKVTIGSKNNAVPGTLTIPKGKGPFPVVILVQGDGELDRDSSIFALKPFKDIALGLANQGIAVLRYEKKTREHYIHTYRTYSVQEEFVEDALASLQLLKSMSFIDKNSIFVAGHSRGGLMVPQIISKAPPGSFAGGIILSSPNPSTTEIESYFEEDSGGMIPEEEMVFYRNQLGLLTQPDFDPGHPPEQFALLPNAYWWYSVKDYRPSSVARSLNIPLFVMQGGADFQVPNSHLEKWRLALQNNTNVTFKLYPDLNHGYTIAGETKTVQDYMQPKHVPFYVLNDIKQWVTSKPKN
ncbi:alpha/beta hydrolase family protein [Gottfriedia sp. NPDC058432]|uniref:alpha/beta hydrolase family protein n=1 Tax=Gottfriedia sp. NPDC058432 TaxID=3346497 RepID=UPI0036666CDD